MKKSFLEPAKEIIIRKNYDVVVAGAGMAGVAAAVTAARCGKRTAVVERLFSMGGLAASGNINIFLPLCDGHGRQVIGGLTEELLLLSVRNREERIPQCWRNRENNSSPAFLESRAKERYQVEFTPAEYQLSLEQIMIDAGVDIFYDTRICGAHRVGSRIEAVTVENKSGRFALGSEVWIDATGDADLAYYAGAPTESLNSNVRAGWGYYIDACGTGKSLVISKHFAPDASIVEQDAFRYRGDSGKSVSRQTIDSRTLLRKRWEEMRQKNPALELVRISDIPGFRMTRRLIGEATIRYEDENKWLPDTVGLFPNWRDPGSVWSLPYRSLYVKTLKNLAVVGRCISASGAAWDQTRVIPVCTLTGEIAGTAAALCSRDTGFPDIDLEILREKLTKNGNILKKEYLTD
jgi:hypothetical protein